MNEPLANPELIRILLDTLDRPEFRELARKLDAARVYQIYEEPEPEDLLAS